MKKLLLAALISCLCLSHDVISMQMNYLAAAKRGLGQVDDISDDSQSGESDESGDSYDDDDNVIFFAKEKEQEQSEDDNDSFFENYCYGSTDDQVSVEEWAASLSDESVPSGEEVEYDEIDFNRKEAHAKRFARSKYYHKTGSKVRALKKELNAQNGFQTSSKQLKPLKKLLTARKSK